MNNFRTEIKLAASTPLSHQSVLLTAGSCFADQLGAQLTHHKFNCLANPFGTTYNPIAIHEALRTAVHGDSINEAHFVKHPDYWTHLDYHSRWSDATRDGLKAQLSNVNGEVGRFLAKVDVVVLTYGTAWAYAYHETGATVGNCQKLPADRFKKFLLSPAQIIDSFESVYQTLRAIRPTLRFLLTVSPVRHTRDTLELNSVSKAALRLACHYLSQQFEGVEYFPSYEIMLDDLRDYRFYETDMIHPNQTAIAYIWEQFSKRYFTTSTQQLNERISALQKDLQHRPFRAGSPSHQQFLKETLRKAEDLNKEVNLEEEIRQLSTQLL